jgi:hypothetical protein
MAFGYFEKAYCLNLPERTDRRRHATEQFEKIGLRDVVFVTAIKPIDKGVFRTQGTHGCALSHRLLFQKAKTENLDNILIFEDDVVFSDDFQEKIGPIIEELKKRTWDIFYFFKPRKGTFDLYRDRGDILSSHRSGLVRTTGSIKTHAFAIHHRCLEELLAKTDPDYLEENVPFETRAIDKVIADLRLVCFGCSTDLTFQDPDLPSSIEVETSLS